MSIRHHYILSDLGEFANDGGSARIHLRKYAINMTSDPKFGTYAMKFFNSLLRPDTYETEPWFKESFSILVRVKYNDSTAQEMFSGSTGYNTVNLTKTVDNQIEFGMGDFINPAGQSWIFQTGPNVATPGVWQDIVCTYDKPNETGRIYVDGALIMEYPFCPAPSYYLDYWQVGTDYLGGQPMHADINEIIIFDEVVGETIVTSYSKRAPLEIGEDYVNLWTLDEVTPGASLDPQGNVTTGGPELVEGTLSPGVPLEIGATEWTALSWKEGF